MSEATATLNLESIRQFYARIEQLFALHERNASSTGELFNVFKVLGLESSEVRLHTALITELLNPQGSHRQGTTFLKAFFEELGITNLDAQSCAVVAEKYIGAVSEDYSEGGRLDISIKDARGHEVIIENKIYAADQKKQLHRYHRYNPDAALYYLTLDGKEPDVASLGDLHAHQIELISYTGHILPWLRACRKEAATLPTVRETISQYMTLIRHLTHQTESEAMNRDIRKLILENPNLVPSIEACSSELQAIKGEVKKEFERLMGMRFPTGFFAQIGDIQIKSLWGVDGDGLTFGYQAFTGKNIVSGEPQNRYVVDALHAARDGFHSDKWWIGWRNPAGMQRGQRLENLPTSDLLDLYSNPEKINAMVDAIVNEEREIRSRFLENLASHRVEVL